MLSAKSLLKVNLTFLLSRTQSFRSKSDSAMPNNQDAKDSALDKRLLGTASKLGEPDQFRLVTYNILADLYADSEYSRTVLFPHCPEQALKIDYRQQLLLKELQGYNADIICLQEVDSKSFKRIYEPYFRRKEGFFGKFDRKGTRMSEGEAIFLRDSRFELVDSHKTIISELIEPIKTLTAPSSDQQEAANIQSNPCPANPSIHFIMKNRTSTVAQELLSKFENIRSVVSSNERLKRRLLDRQTILQTTLIKSKNCPDRYVLIGNTHLYFAPDASHVRLLQGSMCVNYLEFMKDYYTKKLEQEVGQTRARIGVIFCGDMNSSPTCGLHYLLTTGRVEDNFKDWSSNEAEAIVGLEVQTGLEFASAYQDIPYTNYTPQFNGCLDWIYYEKDSFICESIVPLPDHKDVIATGGLPSNVFPSDHLALIANMRFR